ncbi:MAG: hypothetical protein EBS53_00290 [Bacteroidetes bacterium]|jgi:ATP-dependent protease HslVU (ClpYQ) peptidase subunit|nr:hypothetical protein [Bacteroidota bacterium]
MTCIVAIEHEGVVHLGSDSFLGGAFTRDHLARPKFFTKGPRFSIAFAGGLRGAQIVEHDLVFRKKKRTEDEESYLVLEVAKKLHTGFKRVGANIVDEGKVESHDSNFLVCINGKVFVIQDDYSVIRSSHGFAAIGAGQDFALGALSCLFSHVPDMPPKEKVRTALEVAAEFSPQVCGPFHIIEV